MSTATLTEELASMTTDRREAAQTLQADWGAVQLSFVGWPSASCAVKKDKKQKMADVVGAKKISASAPKYDTKDPTWKALTRAKGAIKDHWTTNSLPWVEDGKRLIRQDRIEGFNRKLDELRAELDTARVAFSERYPDLIRQAEEDNGELFDRGAYLDTFTGAYTFSVDFPSLTPPAYLQSMNPTLYAEQSRRVAARFDMAVSLAEETFTAELAKAVEALQAKLAGLDDGTEKVLHASAISNLREFFERFRSLNLHSSAELDRVVEQAEAAISRRDLVGTKPIAREDLRDSEALRREVASRLSAVSAALDQMTSAAPRRALNRRKAPETAPEQPQE